MTNSSNILEKIQRFEGFLQQDPNNGHLLSDVFKLYLEAGLKDKAYALFQKHRDVFLQDDSLSFQGASLHMAHGDFTTAANILENLSEKHPQEFGITYNLAYSLFYIREFSRSLQALTPVLSNDQSTHQPIPSEAYKLAARNSHFLNDYPSATRYLDECLTIQPNDAEALGMQSLVMLDGADDLPEKIEQLANQALSVDPNQHEALLALSQYYIGHKNIDKIIATTQQAVTAHPKSGRAWSYKGQSDMLKLDLAEAETSLDKATTYMPDHIGTWHALGWTCLLNDNVEKAKKAFQAALDLDRNFGESHGGMAIIQIVESQFDDAEKSIRRGIGLDPKCYSARYAKALLLEKSGKTQEAEQLMQDIMRGEMGGEAQMFIELLHNKNLLSQKNIH